MERETVDGASEPLMDRTEGNTGPAHAGATLQFTSTDRPTRTLDHTGGSVPPAEPEDYRLSLHHEEGDRVPQRADVAENADVQPPTRCSSQPVPTQPGRVTRARAAARAAETMVADAGLARVQQLS